MKNTSNESAILVVGATGFLGMEICRQLRAANQNVTALIRKTSAIENVSELRQSGVKLVKGDLKDPESIKNALKGITAVISTASTTRSKEPNDSIQSVDNNGQYNLIQKAIGAGVNQYVYVSFPPVAHDFPLQQAKRVVENKLMESQMSYTILQPTFFMEAWLTPALGFDFANAKATIYGEGENKISWISLQDVAAFAVGALNNPAASNKTLRLGGPASLSPHEVVTIFEKTSGRKFELQHVPHEALMAQYNSVPDDLGKSFSGLMLMYSEGSVINTHEAINSIPVKLKSVVEYANQVIQ